MKKIVAVLLALVMILGLAACGGGSSSSSSSSAEKVIKIGVFETFTGGFAAYGEYEKRGAVMANEEYPEVNGYKIVLVDADNKSDNVEAANAATRLCEVEKVSAVIGSYGSSLCMAAGDIFKENKVPAVAPTSTNVNVTADNPYYFRVCYLDSFQAPMAAVYSYRDLGARKFGMIYEVTSDAATAQAVMFRDKMEEMGGTYVGEAAYNLGDQDFTSQILTVCSQDPDVVLVVGGTDNALLDGQAKDMGYDGIYYISTDGADLPEYCEIGGAGVEGHRCTTFFDFNAPVGPVSEAFCNKYKEKYGEGAPACAALGYDAYLAIYNALLECGEDFSGENVQKHLETVQFEGATGALAFDEKGDAIKDSLIVKVIKDGTWVAEAVCYADEAK